MKATVRLYGHLAWYSHDRSGRIEADLPEGATVGELSKKLGLPAADVKLVAVNGQQRSDSYVLSEGDRVEYVPVIVGG